MYPKFLFAIFMLALVLLQVTLAQNKFVMTASLEPSYIQGADGVVAISISLDEASSDFSEAVVFLNVVEVDAAGKYPQAAHKIFKAASEEPEIFKQVVTRAALEAGIATTLSFTLNNNAKPATYSLVLQVFEGNNTNPNAVNPATRLGIGSFLFDITE